MPIGDSVMDQKELLAEAVRLATESVENGWGGPFGAVLARDGNILARGQNRVLLTGDPTAHAEIETIRKAVQVLNPEAPSIAVERQNESTLEYVPRPPGHRTRSRSGPVCSRALRSTSAAHPAPCA